MAKLPLPQGVGKTVRGGWGCLFIGMHLALKGWMGRKCLVSILVGHGGVASPGLQTSGIGAAMPWALGPDKCA